ncbi:hypothetical protein BHE74_00059557 [Ensete ventricosum]|nr:hypothetical protein BHE74_00059557 [Ensete ventricosum]
MAYIRGCPFLPPRALVSVLFPSSSSALCSSPFLHSSPAKMPSLLPSSPVCRLSSSPPMPPPSYSAATFHPLLLHHHVSSFPLPLPLF